MTGQSDLEARIKVLEDMEAIKALKAKYWRCIDRKLWDEIEGCFTEDVTVDFGPDMQFQGIESLLRFFRDVLGTKSIVTVHTGTGPEIEITGNTSARGAWAFSDYVITEPDTVLRGWGHYDDEYLKDNGQWKIKSTRIIRIREELTTAKS